MSQSVGVPYKLLKAFVNRNITVETSCGHSFKGILLRADEDMSISLSEVKATFINGKTGEMSNIFIKGSRIRLINLDDSAKSLLSHICGEQRSFSSGQSGRFRGGRGGNGGRKPSYERRRY